VLNALPFIVRVLGQRRRDHGDIERALRTVLLSDGGEEALARCAQFDTSVRRIVYELLLTHRPASDGRFIDAALREPDAVLRARAISAVAADTTLDHRVAMLERLLRDDPVPSVRRLVLVLLSERIPDRIGGLFPDVLFDQAASVRDLARFVGRTHQLPFVPRDTYVQGLASARPRQVTAAIAGVGETGTPEDAELVMPFLGSQLPRNRRTSLRALGKFALSHADYLVLPVAFWFFMRTFFPVYGGYADYNQFQVDLQVILLQLSNYFKNAGLSPFVTFISIPLVLVSLIAAGVTGWLLYRRLRRALVEPALRADFALVHAFMADYLGNLALVQADLQEKGLACAALFDPESRLVF
jgi:hypothetical protein